MANLKLKNNDDSQVHLTLQSSTATWKVSADEDGLTIQKINDDGTTQIIIIPSNGLDKYLTQENQIPDSKTVGDKINSINASIDDGILLLNIPSPSDKDK